VASAAELRTFCDRKVFTRNGLLAADGPWSLDDGQLRMGGALPCAPMADTYSFAKHYRDCVDIVQGRVMAKLTVEELERRARIRDRREALRAEEEDRRLEAQREQWVRDGTY